MEDALHKAHREMTDLVDSIPSIIIKLDHEGKIIQWNRTATETLGIPLAAAIGRRLEKCKIKWDLSKVIGVIAESSKDRHLHRLEDVRYERPDGTKGLLSITLSFLGREMDQEEGLILSATDISERRELENHLRQAQRIESIGQLAAGIAHEINTPTQYVGDNIRFLQESLGGLIDLLDVYGQLSEAVRTGSLTPELSNLVEASAREADIEYLKAEIPKAIQQSLEGVAQVSKIVRSMKEFAHPGQTEKVATDLNRAIESTLTVARNEWKYVAEVVTDLDPSLPLVPCHSGDFNQVILNLLTNGAHAIATKVKETGEKGTIGVQTRRVDGWAEIRVRDTGTGIPPEIQSKIFDPFFTTKEVGKGTGQGLAISHSVVVDKHGGSISFETEVGRGTEFIVRLPLGEAPRVS
jgi:PAS domain S-box-containing protein